MFTVADETTFARIESINWSGPLIPSIWFKKLRTGKGHKERCYYEAALCLSQIAYWYRPSREGKKRYRGKRLQLSYKQLANDLGMTKNAVKLATDYLQELGLIAKDFVTIYPNGVKTPNVLFIELNLDRLEELSNGAA